MTERSTISSTTLEKGGGDLMAFYAALHQREYAPNQKEDVSINLEGRKHRQEDIQKEIFDDPKKIARLADFIDYVNKQNEEHGRGFSFNDNGVYMPKTSLDSEKDNGAFVQVSNSAGSNWAVYVNLPNGKNITAEIRSITEGKPNYLDFSVAEGAGGNKKGSLWKIVIYSKDGVSNPGCRLATGVRFNESYLNRAVKLSDMSEDQKYQLKDQQIKRATQDAMNAAEAMNAA